ncbi:hypothetical protein [Amorphus orientalis]|uniref:Uncharacterized protein n=1 Tax=Amorphus orientalis TaxID=649198 RepID=A0AAE3VM73_9HYPH|nr:hypothetical protein [Amorphus orientalis]MDQ0314611.1 hypothetical protein [Amorphus orientalis]
MSNTDYFNDIVRAQAEARRQVDFDDSQQELRGVEVGRIGRFLSPEAREAAKEGRGGSGRSDAGMTALEIALTQADYAEAFHAAEKEIREAQKIVDDLQDDITATIEKMDSRIEEMLDAAATLPDGTKAFMDENGDVWTVDGDRVDQAIVDGIEWDGRPSLETYQSQIAGRERLQELSAEGDGLSLRLGEINNELHNEDHPPSKEEIEAYRAESQSVVERYGEMKKEADSILNPPPEPSRQLDEGLTAQAAFQPLPTVDY